MFVLLIARLLRGVGMLGIYFFQAHGFLTIVPLTVTPSIDRKLHQISAVTDLDLITWGFHRTFATGAACQQRTLTPPDTCTCPTLGLACVLMSRSISPKLVLFTDFLSFEQPSVLLVCLNININSDLAIILQILIIQWFLDIETQELNCI